MGKYAHKRIILIIISCFLLFAAAVPVFGGGRLDAELAKADELIDNREHDEAILLLSDFIRRNPDKFDPAHQRLLRIYNIRDEFNRIADELIDALINDPDNDVKILELSRQLYGYEHENSPLMVNFVSRTQEIAIFNISRTLINEIMETAKVLLERGESLAAIQVYAEGLTFMRDEFFDAHYGTEIDNEVRLETENIHSVIAAFQQASTEMESVLTEFINTINTANFYNFSETENKIISAIDEYIRLKQNLQYSVNVFERILNEIREIYPDMGNRNHLAFLSMVINGRPGELIHGSSDINEGMLGAFDVFWENTFNPVIDVIPLFAENAKNASVAAANDRNYSTAISLVNTMENYINLSNRFLDRNLRFWENSNPQAISLFGNNILLADVQPYMKTITLHEANKVLLQAADLGIRQNIDRSSLTRWQEGRITASQAFTYEQETRTYINRLKNEIDIIKTNAILTSANLRNVYPDSYQNLTHIDDVLEVIDSMYAGFLSEERQSVSRYLTIAHQNIERASLSQWQEGRISISQAFSSEQQTRSYINRMQNEINAFRTAANQINTQTNSHLYIPHVTEMLVIIEGMHANFLTEEHQSVNRYYTIASQSFRNNLTARMNELQTARNYIFGDNRIGMDGIISRYPSEALQILASMQSAAASNLDSTNFYLDQYRREPAAITSVPVIQNTYNSYQSLINDMRNLVTEGLTLADTARTRVAQAEAHRQEGERFYREADLAFQRQDFDTARDRLERASERYLSSLELQESASLRQTRDTQLISLGQAIAIAENEMIIAEVRGLVNVARDAYFGGNYQFAEDSLIRARNRWRVTNADENDEVLTWLGIVRSALSANSGRVISPTAPLYPEMSQLLGQAQRNYDEGVRFVNSGQRSLGLSRFEEARQLLREVKLIYPINQEAGMLELRIDQFIDPVAFNASFEQRLRDAIAGTRMRSIEAYADLQNLAQINPNYPNIRAIVTQAEIDMGYRMPPPNPANVARSRELTASANRIFEAGTTAQYEVALAQLNEAISLYPENTEASQVRDRLLGRMSVPGSIVLTSEDEASYQQALRELNAGNNLVAFALVQRIMQNPRNQNIIKVIELQRRIQSVL